MENATAAAAAADSEKYMNTFAANDSASEWIEERKTYKILLFLLSICEFSYFQDDLNTLFLYNNNSFCVFLYFHKLMIVVLGVYFLR